MAYVRPPDEPEFQKKVVADIRRREAEKPSAKDEEAQRRALIQSALPFAYQEPQPKTRADLVQQIDKLRDYFRYDTGTGLLWYRHQERPGDPSNWRSLATTPHKNGYATANVYGMAIYSAHVVWLLHHGRWPYGRLRRRDGDTLNDRIENLHEPRDTPVPERPTGPRVRRNASRGVARCGPNHWQAYARVGGVQRNLGRFKTEAEALSARAAWELGVDDLV